MAGRGPLYPRLLWLRHLRPSAWQRVLLFEGVIVVAVVTVLADKASLWTIPVLPAVVAMMVKFNDVVIGILRARSPDDNGADPAKGGAVGDDQSRP